MDVAKLLARLRLVSGFCRLFAVGVKPDVVPLVDLLEGWWSVEVPDAVVQRSAVGSPEIDDQVALASVKDVGDFFQVILADTLVDGAVLEIDELVDPVILPVLWVPQDVLEVELVQDVCRIPKNLSTISEIG